MNDKTVTDDPDADLFPRHCITPSVLRSLADALERLRDRHHSAGGKNADLPCVRRIEHDGQETRAHIIVSGGRFVLELRPGGWWLK